MRLTATLGKHVSGALFEALLIATLIGALIAAGATIANPDQRLAGSAQAGRYWLEVDDGVFGGTTEAEVYGDRSDYWVVAKCFQVGLLVSAEWVSADAAGYAHLTLGPTERWTTGAAECTAEAGFYGKNFRWPESPQSHSRSRLNRPPTDCCEPGPGQTGHRFDCPRR